MVAVLSIVPGISWWTTVWYFSTSATSMGNQLSVTKSSAMVVKSQRQCLKNTCTNPSKHQTNCPKNFVQNLKCRNSSLFHPPPPPPPGRGCRCVAVPPLSEGQRSPPPLPRLSYPPPSRRSKGLRAPSPWGGSQWLGEEPPVRSFGSEHRVPHSESVTNAVKGRDVHPLTLTVPLSKFPEGTRFILFSQSKVYSLSR